MKGLSERMAYGMEYTIFAIRQMIVSTEITIVQAYASVTLTVIVISPIDITQRSCSFPIVTIPDVMSMRLLPWGNFVEAVIAMLLDFVGVVWNMIPLEILSARLAIISKSIKLGASIVSTYSTLNVQQTILVIFVTFFEEINFRQCRTAGLVVCGDFLSTTEFIAFSHH